MKKGLLYILTCVLSVFSQAQQFPFQWTVNAIKEQKEGEYRIVVSGIIMGDWYIYGEDKKSEGIKAIKLIFDDERIDTIGAKKHAFSPITIYDSIFQAKLKVYRGQVQFTQKILIKGSIPPSIKVQINAFAARGQEFLPIYETHDLRLEGGIANQSNKIPIVNTENPEADCGDKTNIGENKNLLAIFLFGLGGGLLALLMPCNFPMIPITVSVFIREENKKRAYRNAILYGFFIFSLFVLLTIPFHIAGKTNPEIFNTISTSISLNLILFAVFIVFALSLFGLFELRLPSFLSNKAGAGSSVATISGLFFMALTLVIVSFSCTAPIFGMLLGGVVSNGAWPLTIGAAGFGVALGLPFALFAMFPRMLKSLPKSGGWMTTFKVSLAFVELAFAFKFLSNADLVANWGILKREIFIGIWMLIFLLLAIYLFNIKWFLKYRRFNVSTGKAFFGLLALCFAGYLSLGLTNTKAANLKLLSGFPPPLSYSIYGKKNIYGKGLEPNVINDYDKAIALAKQQNKPLLIDFTGWACVNCRRMEENVWTESEISKLITDNYILVSLYVDDKKKLPVEKRFTHITADGIQRDIKTIGDLWTTFQLESFKVTSQPLYAIVSPDEKLLNNPVGYRESKEYKQWLECGKQAFENKKITYRQ